VVLLVFYQGRRASRLPLAFIFRAVGAPIRISDFLCKAVRAGFAQKVEMPRACPVVFTFAATQNPKLTSLDATGLPRGVSRLLLFS
jgi:hypothetical protein